MPRTSRPKTEAEIRDELLALQDARERRLDAMPEPTVEQIQEAAFWALDRKSAERLLLHVEDGSEQARAQARLLLKLVRTWGPKRGGLPFEILCSYVRERLVEHYSVCLDRGEVGNLLIGDALRQTEQQGRVREERNVEYWGLRKSTEPPYRGDVWSLTGPPPPADPEFTASVRRAGMQYAAGAAALAADGIPDPTDKQVHAYISADEENVPVFETWSHAVRAFRRATGTRKNNPRTARPGRSVKRQNDL